MVYYYIHRNGYEQDKAKNKAFYKAAIVIGVFSFFIYIMFMNILNQLLFDLDNTRTNGFLITGPFILLFYFLAEKKLKHRLKLVEDVSVYDANKLKDYNKFQIKVAVLAGVYATVMFCLIRLTNIYLL